MAPKRPNNKGADVPRRAPAMRRLVATFALAAIGGCSEPTTGRVIGTILVDGQPAKEGAIAYFPLSGKGKTAGGPIVDGKYEAEVEFGQFKVEIRVPKKVGEAKLYNTPDSPVKPILDELLPDKYNNLSELTLEVKPGENRQDYDLKSR